MLHPAQRPSRRPGNVISLMAILIVFLVAMVAFAIDTPPKLVIP